MNGRMECIQIATSTVTPNATGTFTFNADGTYAENTTVDESGTLAFPASCVTNLASCSGLDETNTVEGVVITETCSGDVSKGCTCAFSQKGAFVEAGTYSTGPTTVSTTPTGGSTTGPAGYCVSGSQLQLATGTSTGAGGGSSAGAGYLLFTRQ